MSNEGVMLMHDICERTADFGVWKLWAEIKTRYPTFEFLHEHGLGGLATGTKIKSALPELFALTEAETTNVRACFESLGMGLTLNLERAALIKRSEERRVG